MVLAALVVVAGAIVGLTGLLANPIQSQSAGGAVAVIAGSFEPVTCDSTCGAACPHGCAQGYVAAGARSVFVRFPPGCPVPAFGQRVSIKGRRDSQLGSEAYLASACA